PFRPGRRPCPLSPVLVRRRPFDGLIAWAGTEQGGSMPRKHVVSLTDEQRRELQALVNSGRSPARKITRARVLLKSEAGLTDEEIVDALDVGLATVERVRRRFGERGLAAALDASPPPPRPHRRG